MARLDRPTPGQNAKQMGLTVAAIIVGAIIIFGGGAYLCTQIFGASTINFSESNTTVIHKTDYDAQIEVDGKIRAAGTISVSPEVDGTISNVAVEEYDKVKKGDLLFTIKNASIVKAAKDKLAAYEKAIEAQTKAADKVTKAKADLKSAKKNLEKAKAKAEKEAEKATEKARKAAEKAAKEAKKAQESSEDGEESSSSDTTETEVNVDDITVDVDFDATPYETAITAAENAVESAEDTLEAMDANVESAKSEYEAAAKQRRALNVKAKKAGSVINLKVEKGMSTQAVNAQGAAMQIVDLDSLVCVAQVPQNVVSSISKGDGATVTAADIDREYSATVSRIADTPTQASEGEGSQDESTLLQQTYGVTLVLGTSEDLRMDMDVKAKFTLDSYSAVYLVPNSAVGNENGVNFVVVVYEDNTTKVREVTVLGQTDDGSQTIVQGNTLNEGQTVRTDIS